MKEGGYKRVLETLELLNKENPRKEIIRPYEYVEKERAVGDIFDKSYWSLHSEGKELLPLKFSNGKTQEDVVKEVVESIKSGTKVIIIRGVCGTGKSAIALNIGRCLGRASIVVPVKALQTQYEKDYAEKKYLIKQNGERLKITVITGRDNHESRLIPGVSCSDPSLPENIKIIEKNYNQISDYYKKNPLISNTAAPELKNVKRISIAPSNPYWSPIMLATKEIYLPDAKKKKYSGLSGKDFIFYHRRQGCSYYDQYQSYIDSDIIIFNSAKYKIETDIERKPSTDVEIIDEADEFLDSFSTQQTINLTRLANSLNTVIPDDRSTDDAIKEIIKIIKMEELNKRAIGIEQDKIYKLAETPINKIIEEVLENPDIENEIIYDESNYALRLLELVKNFSEFIPETFITYKRYEDELYVSLVTTNLSKKFKEIVDKNKAVVLMSGTFHSDAILKNVFGITDFKVVEAETKFPGTIEIALTGKEFDCKYSNFYSKAHTREEYLQSLSTCLEKAKKPTLIHVNAFEDLPNEKELSNLQLINLPSKERLIETQRNDRNGNSIEIFKSGLSNTLFTTKCARGVDFPGETCNSVIFTKFPNPNPNDIFWKVLKQTHPEYFWEFYKDKASREFLQKIYRALRFDDDNVIVLSPDSRVISAVRDIQKTT